MSRAGPDGSLQSRNGGGAGIRKHGCRPRLSGQGWRNPRFASIVPARSRKGEGDRPLFPPGRRRRGPIASIATRPSSPSSTGVRSGPAPSRARRSALVPVFDDPPAAAGRIGELGQHSARALEGIRAGRAGRLPVRRRRYRPRPGPCRADARKDRHPLAPPHRRARSHRPPEAEGERGGAGRGGGPALLLRHPGLDPGSMTSGRDDTASTASRDPGFAGMTGDGGRPIFSDPRAKRGGAAKNTGRAVFLE